jgi:DNA-binding MarR family transcriptional regulator
MDDAPHDEKWRPDDPDDPDAVAELRPILWGQPPPRSPSRPTFIDLHGAYHVLSRRLAIETRAPGLTASEAVVLAAARLGGEAAIATVRHMTGLRPSTLTSLLDRLEDRDVIRRVPQPHDAREVTVVLNAAGTIGAEASLEALLELDRELEVFLAKDSLAHIRNVFEASRALGVPGTAADY